MNSIRLNRFTITCGLALLLSQPLTRAEEAAALPVKTGEKVAFLGDSITQFGWGSPLGYVRLIVSGLEANGVKVEPIPAGISGHKSNDMLGRLDRDVLSKKPDWVTISCGVNDVWHGPNGVPLDAYKTNMTAIVDQAQAAKVKVMILTATMINEDAGNPNNQKLAAYNDFLRALAAEKKCLLADLNTQMQEAVANAVKAGGKPGKLLTGDGVHMNLDGNMMMATGVLKAFGLSQTQLDKATEAWMDIPAGVPGSAKYSLTLREYRKLEKVARDQKKSVGEYVDTELAKVLKDAVK